MHIINVLAATSNHGCLAKTLEKSSGLAGGESRFLTLPMRLLPTTLANFMHSIKLLNCLYRYTGIYK